MSNAYEKWPAVRRLVDEAIEKGDLPYQMLADVEYHARRHQLALTFHDAVELVRTFQQEAGRRRALADVPSSAEGKGFNLPRVVKSAEGVVRYSVLLPAGQYCGHSHRDYVQAVKCRQQWGRRLNKESRRAS